MGCFLSCMGDAVPPPTENAVKFVTVLKILTFLQLIISILNLASVYFIR